MIRPCNEAPNAIAAPPPINGADAAVPGVVGALAPLRAAGFTREALDMILLPMVRGCCGLWVEPGWLKAIGGAA